MHISPTGKGTICDVVDTASEPAGSVVLSSSSFRSNQRKARLRFRSLGKADSGQKRGHVASNRSLRSTDNLPRGLDPIEQVWERISEG